MTDTPKRLQPHLMPIPHGGFTFWKIEPHHAPHHPMGAQFAGLCRSPDGRLWGINAVVVDRGGRRHFEGGLFPVDEHGNGPPAEWAPEPGLLPPPCVESQIGQAAPQAGEGVEGAHVDLVEAAQQMKAFQADRLAFDDSAALEGLPL